jgi:L-alanine-DL-glutamate epimerase-like enolase superfamily enzyme
LHVAAVIPEIAWGLTLTNNGLAADITPHPLAIRQGHAEVSDRAGLGIDVDEDRVQRYRIAER